MKRCPAGRAESTAGDARSVDSRWTRASELAPTQSVPLHSSIEGSNPRWDSGVDVLVTRTVYARALVKVGNHSWSLFTLIHTR